VSAPDPTSRHADAPTYRVAPDVELLVPRVRTQPPAVQRHVAQASDRLDTVASTYLGDPHLYWRIADANPAVEPRQLLEPGATIDIPGAAS
jgi:hypothetical protein